MGDAPQIVAIQQLGRTYRAVMAAFEVSIGYSLPRWRILLTLYQSGASSQKQLACMLRVDPAALTRQIKAIEQEGVIERHADAEDNRLTNVALTEAGRRRVEAALPLRTAFIERAFADFSPEQAQALTDLLHTLELRMREPLS